MRPDLQRFLRNITKVFEYSQFFLEQPSPSKSWNPPKPHGRGYPACVALHGDRQQPVVPAHACTGTTDMEGRWSRPVSRVLYALRRDSHSSRPGVAAWLQQPTRGRRGPRQCPPIWSCSEWGLPCHAALTPRAVRSYRTVSPLPVPLRAIGGLLSVALAVGSRRPGVTWHSALWSPDFPRCACARRDCPADSAEDCSAATAPTNRIPLTSVMPREHLYQNR